MKTKQPIVKLLYLAVPLILLVLAVRYKLMNPPENEEFRKPAGWTGINAPYITSSEPSVRKMVELAEITADDIVYDLGCGDGRLVIAAVASAGCRGVGIDIDGELVKKSVENATKQNVADKIEFRQQDIFETDMSECTVALMYLTGWMIEKLEPQLDQMKPGSRIMTQDYYIQQVRPHRAVKLMVPDENGVEVQHIVYLYKTPLQRDPKMERGKPPQPADALDPTQ